MTVSGFNSGNGEITIDSTSFTANDVIKVTIAATTNYTYTVADTTVTA